jgi:hypothetical protein
MKTKAKHGDITTEKIVNDVWVAMTMIVKPFKAEAKIRGTSEAEAYKKMVQFLNQEDDPYYIDKNGEGRTYKFGPSSEDWKEILDKCKSDTPAIIEEYGEYFVDYFSNVLPPITWGNDFVLCSEPYSHDDNGHGEYLGIYTKEGIYYGVTTTVSKFKSLKNG